MLVAINQALLLETFEKPGLKYTYPPVRTFKLHGRGL